MRRDTAWIATHSGPVTARTMSEVLSRIARRQGQSFGDLALTRIARAQDPFHVLVACIISLRTKDEVTDVVAPRLLAIAPTPTALSVMDVRKIAKSIYPAGFYRTKGKTLRNLARVLVEQHDGAVPDTLEGLLALSGVGRKTANLVLTLGFGKPGICVDVHVHRICNRIGFVRTGAPDDTEQVLRSRLPKRWWIPINDLLVMHGRTICTPLSPWCSRCPVAGLCRRIGIDRSR